MNGRLAVSMLRSEGRSTLRRLLLYVSSVAAGVAALVAIQSLRASVDHSVAEQARELLGADLELRSRQPWGAEAQPLIAALEAAGGEAAYVTRFSSMALAESTERARMVWVSAFSGPFPHYGSILSEPAGAWETLAEAPRVLVDPAALVQMGARVGERLRIGELSFEIAGTVLRAPGRMGMREAVAPRAFIHARYLDETRLLQMGSLARYAAYFRSDDPRRLERVLAQQRSALRAERIRTEDAGEFAADLSEDLGQLARFLGLVGLCALLLGGVGVATGVHAFVSEKLDGAAVLRCLGARTRDVFAVYVLQAGALGLLGSTVGAGLGLVLQGLLPWLAGSWLSFDLALRVDWVVVVSAVGLGLWVTLLFAALPLLELRGVTPLRALRREFDARPVRGDPLRRVAWIAMGVTLGIVSLWQAPNWIIGAYFAAGLMGSIALLGAAAWALIRATRRFAPSRAPYWLRQGVANLFRPRNQTLAVTLALGLGVFLIAALHAVQFNLLGQLDFGRGPERPNLAVFDIQRDQRDGVLATLREHGAQILEETPIVPARIARAGGRSAEGGSPDRGSGDGAWERRRGRRGWALRRQYRVTYRGHSMPSETVVEGRWWEGAEPREDGVTRVSLEDGLARDLGVGVGDRITWDVQGVRIESEVANLRSVDWARFQTNFFAVLEPGVLEEAPQMLVVIARVASAEQRAQLQTALVDRFPNLSVLDASLMLQSLDALLGRIALAIRFMASFAIGAGLLILIGTLSTSRYQRARESVLLRTLGAQGATIRRILATEYLALGALAGVVGVGLAALGCIGLMALLFETSAQIPWLDLLAFALGTGLASAVIGLTYGRDALRQTPLAAMRELFETR